MTTPRSKSSDRARYATAGVGTMPADVVAAPCEAGAPRELTFDPFAGFAGIAADDDPRRVRRRERPHDRGAHPRHGWRVERPGSGHASDAVGSEESGHLKWGNGATGQ